MPRRCAFGCPTSNDVTRHRFPDFQKFPERFKTWVTLLGGQLKTPSDVKHYKQMVICDIHFCNKYKNRNNRLNALAIPTLNLPGQSKNQAPLKQASTSLQVLEPAESRLLIEGTSKNVSTGRITQEHSYSGISQPNTPSTRLTSAESLSSNSLLQRTTVHGYSTEKQQAAEKPKEEGKQPPPSPLPTTIEECHKQIEALTNEVNTLKQQAKDFEDKYKRALADGENVRRRMTKQVEDAKSFAIQSFCKDLLDVADTLAAAADSVPDREVSEAGSGGSESGAAAALRSLHDGVRLTRAQLTQVFSRHGLVVVSPLREKFDPNLHEALFQQEVEGAQPGTVVAVSKVGYKLHERCVRPALVGVAK